MDALMACLCGNNDLPDSSHMCHEIPRGCAAGYCPKLNSLVPLWHQRWAARCRRTRRFRSARARCEGMPVILREVTG